MKSKVFKLIVLLVLLSHLTGCRKNEAEINYDRSYINEIKTARKDVSFYMARNFVPGANVAVAKEGKIIYSEGLGLASKDLEVPARRSTKFRIGEVSEVFTTLLYHIMVEKGILHPDSAVQSYYPQFPEKQYSISLRHLVQQTSGIRPPTHIEEDWRGLNISIKKGIENFENDSLQSPPGMFQISSMFNYNLLGAIMEETTGRHFHNLLKDYVTDTLALANTQVDNPLAVIENRSDYFDHDFIAQVVHATTRDMRYRVPSSGLLSNAEDLVKFGNALLFSEYISDDIREKLFEPLILPGDIPALMSNGWITLEDRSGKKFYGKSGSVTGGSAAILIYPEDELVVAFASNLSAISEDMPVFHIAGHFLPDDNEEQQTPQEK
ncbi:MAG: serine hydrolase domain-containing protein [Mariniphaga sp.]